MTEADTQTSESQGQGVPAAGAQEQPQIQVPKYRLDEVSAQLRAAREELALKDQVLQRLSQPQQQAQVGEVENDEQDAQELGLDPQAYKAIKKLADKVADRKLKTQAKQFGSQVATMANNLEETQFLLKYGKENEKYLARLRETRALHYSRTGGYLDMDTAYKIMRFDETMARQAQQVQVPQGQQQQAPQHQAPSYGYPAPEASRMQAPSGGLPPAKKSYSEMSPDEMEAALDEELRRSGGLI